MFPVFFYTKYNCFIRLILKYFINIDRCYEYFKQLVDKLDSYFPYVSMQNNKSMVVIS